MPIPNRTYTPGELDPVFKRTVPTAEPKAADYTEGDSPDPLIVDIVLHLRAVGNPVALEFDLESVIDASSGKLDASKLLVAVTPMVETSDSVAALEFATALIENLDQWADARLPENVRQYIEAMPPEHLDEMQRHITEALGLSAEERITFMAERREQFRAKLQADLVEEAVAAPVPTGHLAGRVRTPRPDYPAEALRTVASHEERHEFGRQFTPVFAIIQKAVEWTYDEKPETVQQGLARLRVAATGLAAIRDDVLAAIAAVDGPLTPRLALEKRRVAWLADVVEQTEDLVEILDPAVLDEELYVAFINRLNTKFVEHMLADHEAFMRKTHGEHEACHVKDNDFRMLRPVYQRVVSTEAALDNALSGLESLSGVLLDANSDAVMPYALTLHFAMVDDLDTIMKYELKRDGGRTFANLIQVWGQSNLEFMKLLQVKPVSELLAENEGNDMLGDVPPGAAMGAGLSISPTVFVPRRTAVREALDEIRALANTGSGDAELFIPEDWNGGTE